MKTIIRTLIIICVITPLLSFDLFNVSICSATWYDTSRHPIVHRPHSTAAISRNLIQKMGLTVGIKHRNIKGSFLMVTNVFNNKVDTVEITDVCGYVNHVDLSKYSFGKLANHGQGKIKVVVKKI